MPDRKLDVVRFLRPYTPTQAITGSMEIPAYLGGLQHSIIDGQNCWLRNNRLESALGPGVVGALASAIPQLMSVGNTYGGMTGSGSIVQFYNFYFYAGAGSGVLASGGVIGSVTGQSLMLVKVGGGV